MYKILLFRGRRATLKTENSESENLLLAIWKNAEQAVAYKTNKEKRSRVTVHKLQGSIVKTDKTIPAFPPPTNLVLSPKKATKKMQRMMQPHPVIKKIDSRSNWPSIWFTKQSRERPAMCVLCLSVFFFFFSSSPGLVFSPHKPAMAATRRPPGSSPGNPVFPPPRFLRCHVRIVATAATWPLIWSPSLLNRHVAYMVRRLTLLISFRCVLGFGTFYFCFSHFLW